MRIVVFTTDGLSREDGNVYYSNYLVVTPSKPSLKFNESIFADDQTKDQVQWTIEARALGYIVDAPVSLVIIQP